MTPAEILLSNALVAARSAKTGIGCASAVVPGYGTATATYSRVTRTYDVGAPAKSHATGCRSAVLPALVAILARAS